MNEIIPISKKEIENKGQFFESSLREIEYSGVNSYRKLAVKSTYMKENYLYIWTVNFRKSGREWFFITKYDSEIYYYKVGLNVAITSSLLHDISGYLKKLGSYKKALDFLSL